MGTVWIVNTPELEQAFKRDWTSGMPLILMAALYGFRNVNGVSRTARRLGLPKRKGGPSVNGLYGGEWVPGPHGIKIWKEHDEDRVV